MSFSWNQVTLIGNVGQEPELKYTPSQKPVTQLSVATSRFGGTGDNPETVTDWHTVVVWGKVAEWVASNVRKGDRVFVSGELRADKYEHEGRKVTYWKIHTFNVLLLTSRQSGEPKPTEAPATKAENKKPGDNELPF